MTIKTKAEGRAKSPNSGTGTVRELSDELVPPLKNNVMLSPLTKSMRRRIRWPATTSTPVLLEQENAILSPPGVDKLPEQIVVGESPLLSVMANAIPSVVLLTDERSRDTLQSP